MTPVSNNVVRFTAWSAIVGGLFAYMNVALMTLVTGGDIGMVFHGASMLTLPSGTRDLFRLSMFADILGFYLPLLVMGGYLWHVFRQEAGALGDMAVLAILAYVVLGVSGAAAQLAALHPLAHLHAGGDGAVKAAAEAAWNAIAYVSQRGLWWSEGPLVFFWGMVIGSQLKHAGWGALLRIPLKIVGWGFGLFFVFGFFPSLNTLTNLMLIIVVLIFPAWMIMFGGQLLRQPISPDTSL